MFKDVRFWCGDKRVSKQLKAHGGDKQVWCDHELCLNWFDWKCNHTCTACMGRAGLTVRASTPTCVTTAARRSRIPLTACCRAAVCAEEGIAMPWDLLCGLLTALIHTAIAMTSVPPLQYEATVCRPYADPTLTLC